jgi:hypothetical protein
MNISETPQKTQSGFVFSQEQRFGPLAQHRQIDRLYPLARPGRAP